MRRLVVSGDGRHLCGEDGSAFLYLADTAWEALHRLTKEELAYYLDDRAQKGFTVIQTVLLAEFGGLTEPNRYGRLPLKKNDMDEYDPCLPDTDGEYSYWDHVDLAVRLAGDRDMYLALLPTWGDKWNRMWGGGPEIFTPENAYRYGRWLGERYADRDNIIWILGGDRPLKTRRHFEIIRNMALGLREGDGGRHLITLHPCGGMSSSEWVHEEEWLDFNMFQSGHTRSRFNYLMVEKDRSLCPPKPVLDGEPGYEDHPESFDPANGYLDQADVRQFAYMSLLSGACGHTYGDHSCWRMVEKLPVEGFRPAHFCLTWRQAIHSPGSGQMKHVRALMESVDLLGSVPRPEWIGTQLKGVLYQPVLECGKTVLVYTAQGQPVKLRHDVTERIVSFRWFDPRTGESLVKEERGDADRFVPPSGGRGNDWILLLDME